jgi:predicted nucleotidyltransferase
MVPAAIGRFGMKLQPDKVGALKAWACANENVRQLWLFGSRAEGTAKSESDVDVAIALMPPDGTHDWALGNYTDLGDSWQRELGAIIGRHVSLEVITPGSRGDIKVRQTGVLLWARE